MKLKADRASLIKALAHIQSVAEKRNTIPILANALIAVRGGKLSLTATDMEIAIVEEVPAATSRDGATTAPAVTLYEIVRKLPEGAEVELDFAGGERTFGAAGRAIRHEPGDAADRRFPLHDRRAIAASLPSVGLGLARADRPDPLSPSARRRRATTSTASSCMRPRAKDGRVLRAVATDGHRLARVEEPLPAGRGLDAGGDRAAEDDRRIAQAAG